MGHALLTQVEDEVRARGGRLLLVETSATAAYGLARHLYEMSGYRCEALVHDFYAPGDDLLICAEALKADRRGRELTEIYQGSSGGTYARTSDSCL